MTPSSPSPPWSPTTKAIVAATAVVLTGILVWAFRGLIQQLVLAALLAYLLHPLVSLLDRRTGLQRGSAVLLVYGTLLIVVLVALSIVGVTTAQQVIDLFQRLPALIEDAPQRLQALLARLPETIAIGPFVFELAVDRWLTLLPNGQELLQGFSQQVGTLVGGVLSQGGSLALGAVGVVGATVNVLGLIFLVFIISIYIAIDIPRFGSLIGEVAQQPGYRADAERLMADISRVWAGYLRGQFVLGLVIFFLVSAVLGVLRVNNAIGLGLLSGAMEFLPVIGPLIGAGAAILVALFQPDTAFGLTQLQYVLVVAGAMFLIQQVENNLLVPRIVGDALELHPLLVMVSVIMGASLAGLLGAVLAAPVVSSLKVLGIYAWHKMLDLPPFPPEERIQQMPEPPRGPGERLRSLWLWTRLRTLMAAREVAESSSLPVPVPQEEMPIMGNEMPIYPLRFEPVFKDYIWGGRRLQTVLGRDLPEGIVAESWEVAAHPNGETRVADGPLAGLTLSEAMAHMGTGLVGSRNRRALESGRFPLLIKLLDAARWLSVQVHPDDEYGLAYEHEYGKTEMWLVLHAEPDAELIFGLRRGVTREAFERGVAAGRSAELLHRIPVQKGDVIFVPAGAVHALGPGLVVAEIQQNSDTTYRIYDWDRPGHDGKPRPLHVEKALQVIDWSLQEPGPVTPSAVDGGSTGIEIEELVRCPYFQTRRLHMAAGSRHAGCCGGETFQIWGVLEGEVALESRAPTLSLAAVEWVLLPADLGDFALEARVDSVLVEVLVPEAIPAHPEV